MAQRNAVLVFALISFLIYGVASISMEEDCLEIHNKYRVKHQAPPVTWSPLVAESAYNWSVYLASINAMKHESSGFADNIYMSYGKAPDNPCTKAVTAFYSEERFYDYDDPLAKWYSYGHFTQVVWKSTTEIGAAFKEFQVTNSKNKTKTKYVVVVKYRPAGNFMSKKKYKENVLPPLEDPETTTPAPVTLTPNATAGTSTNLTEDCLEIHNKFRAIHQAPPVTWSPLVAESAYNWSIYLASINAMKHESSGFADNLYLSYGKAPDNPCTKAVTAFYSEVKFYDYDDPLANYRSTGHFTQVVWKSTTEIGAAYKEYQVTNSKNKTKTKYVVVVKYRPAGNFMSEKKYKENVLRPLSDDNGVHKIAISFRLVLGAVVATLTGIYCRFN